MLVLERLLLLERFASSFQSFHFGYLAGVATVPLAVKYHQFARFLKGTFISLHVAQDTSKIAGINFFGTGCFKSQRNEKTNRHHRRINVYVQMHGQNTRYFLSIRDTRYVMVEVLAIANSTLFCMVLSGECISVNLQGYSYRFEFASLKRFSSLERVLRLE